MNKGANKTQETVEQAVQDVVEAAAEKVVQETAQPAPRTVEVKYRGGSSEAVYGLGMIGAWIYYIGRARNFQEGAIGFLKGLVWPVFVVYKALVLLDGKPGDQP
jgi:hypothetical protein